VDDKGTSVTAAHQTFNLPIGMTAMGQNRVYATVGCPVVQSNAVKWPFMTFVSVPLAFSRKSDDVSAANQSNLGCVVRVIELHHGRDS